MAGNPSPRKNVSRERAAGKKPKFKGGPAGEKKLSPEAKSLRKKKITNKEAAAIIKKDLKARKIKRQQKGVMDKNRPDFTAGNRNLT